MEPLMNEYMHALAVVGERRVEIIEVPLVQPKFGEVLVRIRTCALCTWEQRIFSGVKKVPYPLVGGHEIAGEIYALGEGVDPDRYPLGSPVALRVLKNCQSCHFCRRGMENLCVELNTFRLNGPEAYGMGGLAEYISIERSAVWVFENNLPFETMALTEPLACVLNSIKKGNVHMGDDVLIIGGGVMGQLHVLAAKLAGGRTILSEPDSYRRDVARSLGCNVTIDPTRVDIKAEVGKLTGGRGADVVFNTTAISEVAQTAVLLTAAGGTCVTYSSQHPDLPITISPNWLHNSETNLTGAVNPSVESFDQSVKLIDKGLVDPSVFVSKTFAFTDGQQAFEAALQPENFRVVVKF